MHTENPVIDECSHGETVEAIGEDSPNLDTETAFTLVVEAVDTIDRGTLVVSSKKEEVFRELDLVSEQETNRFKALLATVHVISKKQVV